MKATTTRSAAKLPGWYVLRINGEVVDQGEEKAAEFCIRAREHGAGAEVEEIQHPGHNATPFGFHYTAGVPGCI